MQKSFLRTPTSTNEVEHLPGLTGVYKNDTGMSLYFDPPFFRMTGKDETVSGGFSTYTLGTDILDLRVTNENGIVIDRRCYSFDFIEERRETEIVRRLVLRPGEIHRNGFRPTDDSPLVFHQREVIQDETEEQENQVQNEDRQGG